MPFVTVQALYDAREQAASAYGQHHRVRLASRLSNLVDHGGVPMPQQRIVKRMQEGIIRA